MERAHAAAGHAKSLEQTLESVDLLEVEVDFFDACEAHRGRQGRERCPARRRPLRARRRSRWRRASAAWTPSSCCKCSSTHSEWYRSVVFRRFGSRYRPAEHGRRPSVPRRTSTDRCRPVAAARGTSAAQNPSETLRFALYGERFAPSGLVRRSWATTARSELLVDVNLDGDRPPNDKSSHCTSRRRASPPKVPRFGPLWAPRARFSVNEPHIVAEVRFQAPHRPNPPAYGP